MKDTSLDKLLNPKNIQLGIMSISSYSVIKYYILLKKANKL